MMIIRPLLKTSDLSFPRRRESSFSNSFWIPAFAGMTLLAVFIFHPVNLFAEVVGSVTASLGNAYVTREGAKDSVVVKRGDGTHFLDTYETKAKSRLKILFEDDSIISLGENSKIVITESVYDPGEKKRSTTINMVSGSLRALVGKGFAGGKSKFEVHTPTSVAAARGTYFMVWVSEVAGKTVSGTLVLEGEVAVSGGGESVVLGPGQTVSVQGGEAIGDVKTASPALIAHVLASTDITDLLDQTEFAISESETASGNDASFLSPDFGKESVNPTDAGNEPVGPPGGDTPNSTILNTHIWIEIPVR